MRHSGIQVCTICGEARPDNRKWFLIAANGWEDTVKILRWNDALATQSGIHSACSAAHVKELVLHWMTTGSLDYPFASVALQLESRATWDKPTPPAMPFDASSASPIGEVAVHRESIRRILIENPASLKCMLEALLAALRRESGCAGSDASYEEAAPWVFARRN